MLPIFRHNFQINPVAIEIDVERRAAGRKGLPEAETIPLYASIGARIEITKQFVKQPSDFRPIATDEITFRISEGHRRYQFATEASDCLALLETLVIGTRKPLSSLTPHQCLV